MRNLRRPLWTNAKPKTRAFVSGFVHDDRYRTSVLEDGASTISGEGREHVVQLRSIQAPEEPSY